AALMQPITAGWMDSRSCGVTVSATLRYTLPGSVKVAADRSRTTSGAAGASQTGYSIGNNELCVASTRPSLPKSTSSGPGATPSGNDCCTSRRTVTCAGAVTDNVSSSSCGPVLA